jgi:hypothetical protein
MVELGVMGLEVLAGRALQDCGDGEPFFRIADSLVEERSPPDSTVEDPPTVSVRLPPAIHGPRHRIRG